MILTVISGRNEGDWFDISVPNECSVTRLNELLGLRLFQEPPSPGIQYILEAKFPEGLWFTVDGNPGVVEAGLREGAFIRLQRAFSTTEEEAPVYGRRMLFQES
ncbi:hypothetical protein MNQ98_19095 [Paenibacillus sp. N3/727]|uniref:hypothetical protein n=1 Tax=Paenibacillus sp. N3/727 TaxID=2925845 RepID=UPI001F5384B4|nr:hypothetical protein [Paenibacillus sp. N3/727]UNK16596.1 hypothetical protein MNQ98_19095 [Paenibacillus sp. N3/727]